MTNTSDTYSYKVASLLYTAVSDDFGQTASTTIAKNFDNLKAFAEEASVAGASVMVFPESTTGTLEWPDFNKDKAAAYAEVYPEVGTSVCDGGAFDDTQSSYQHYTTACMAKNNSLYVVMNIPELLDCSTTDGQQRALQESSPAEVTCADLTDQRRYLFNSLAIYDPSGTLIAKYRKTSTFPLYYDTAFPEQNKEKADFTTFTTDFGVEFGVLICADATNPLIIPKYAESGIEHILLPLYDGGRPPVTSITAIHAGHSYNYGVNVIASQSQTFSGVGVYTAGRPLFWNVNPDPFSGEPYSELIVVELAKRPEPQVPLANLPDIVVDNDATVETCRWLGFEDTEVECPCIKIEVSGDEPVDFAGTLTQMVDEEEMECSISASLSTTANGTQNYAMMVGWRNSTQLDYALFCEIVTCADFPDCSKDCPLCLAPYMGMATLKEFHIQTTVPDYFENGDRMMHFPIMNTFGGMPVSGDAYAWTSDGTTRSMSLLEDQTVDNLMGAGIFYIGFAPLVESTDPPTTTSGGGKNSSDFSAVFLFIVLVLMAILHR